VSLLLCDCVRISFRDKTETEASITEGFISDLLHIAESADSENYSEANITTSGMALRSLINVMNDNNPASNLFLSQTINGVSRILAILKVHGKNDKHPLLMQYATKLLYMLLSQRSVTLSDNSH
jgi:type VI protein secretion system component VasF